MCALLNTEQNKTKMTSSATIRIQDANLSKLVFGKKQPPPKDSTYQIDNIFISYENDKQWPRFQFPILEHPFDSFSTKYGGNADGSIDMLLSFDPANAKHKKTMDKLKEIDALVFGMVKDNSATWLQKPLTTEDKVADFLDPKEGKWFPSLRIKKDKDYEDRYFSIKFKIPKRAPKGGGEKKLATEVKDMDTDEVVDIFESLTPKCHVQVIGRPARVYIQKQKTVGIVWEASFMRIRKNETANAEKELFVVDSDEENDNSPAAAQEDDTQVHEEGGDILEDTDDVEEEEEEVVAAKTKPASKGRAKKATK